ncbi:hypothetical protein [Thiolapillus sp.]
MNKLVLLCNIILVILGAVMIGLGINDGILPPAITGAGFFVIALALQAGNRN